MLETPAATKKRYPKGTCAQTNGSAVPEPAGLKPLAENADEERTSW
jgi:hypothetical protein